MMKKEDIKIGMILAIKDGTKLESRTWASRYSPCTLDEGVLIKVFKVSKRIKNVYVSVQCVKDIKDNLYRDVAIKDLRKATQDEEDKYYLDMFAYS